MTKTIKSTDAFPVAFNEDFRDVLAHKYTEFCECGGRGSCKSSFISIAIIALILSNKNFNALVLRKVAETLQDSVFEQLLWAIDLFNMSNAFKATTRPLRITRVATGQRIVFKGADEPKRIKSIKLKTGYFAVTWFEELTEFSPDDITQIKLSTMRGGGVFWVFYSFNPPASARNWCNAYFLKERRACKVHKSDYRDVPAEWLGEAFLWEAEDMKERNARAYANIFLGEATGTGRNIFENVNIREITGEEIATFDFVYCGVDWGYFPDPFAYVRMSYDAARETLYIFDELYLYKHGNYEAFKALAAHMESRGQNIARERITADSAEPKSVADFRRWGADMRGAVKGAGSLQAGLKWLQGLKSIIIDGARCPKCADEFSLYEYEIDRKTGEILQGYPQGQPDHGIAAARYALEEIWRRRGE